MSYPCPLCATGEYVSQRGYSMNIRGKTLHLSCSACLVDFWVEEKIRKDSMTWSYLNVDDGQEAMKKRVTFADYLQSNLKTGTV